MRTKALRDAVNFARVGQQNAAGMLHGVEGRLKFLRWLDALASETAGPVLVFGHHYVWDLHSADRNAYTFGINPDDSEALAEVIARRENMLSAFVLTKYSNEVAAAFYKSTGARIATGDDLLFVYDD